MSRHHHPLIAYLIRRTTSRRFLVGNLLFLALVCAIFTSSTGKNHPVSKRAKASLEKGGRYLKSLAYEDDFSTGNGTTGFGSKWSEGSAGYCSEAAYLDGRWIQREKPFETEEEVRQAWGLTDMAELKCQAVDDSIHRVPGDAEYAIRVKDVAAYEWRPKSGCRKRPFTREAFIKRMLRSKAGLVFVGDSLTEHSYAAIHSLLVAKDGLVLGDGTPDQIFKMWLNMGHPDAARLVAEAGVDPERASRPLVKFYRDHHIVSREEMDDMWKDMPGYMKQADRDLIEGEGKIQWVKPYTKWWGEWLQQLSAPVYTVPKQGEGPVAVREEKSVIIFQLGPHWSAGELGPLANQMTERQVADGYTQAMVRTIQKLQQLSPQDAQMVSAFWRSNSPGDPECEQYTGPVDGRTTHFSERNPDAFQFNWNKYPEMNRHASSRLSYVPSGNPDRLNPVGPNRMRYLDIWPISVQRPDAHLKPAIDCMHYCMPSVPNEWMSFIWHLILTDSLNKDYVP